MKTLGFTSALALCLATVTAPLSAQESHSDAVENHSLPVGSCINLGNTLEPETEGAWGGARATKSDFERIAAAGFETVRIPVRWHNKSSSKAPYTVDEAWMDRVQQIVDWALAADLDVILNSHHFDPIHETPLAVAEWHGGVWAQIAERFSGYPEDSLWFELENEPHKNFDHSNLLQTLRPSYEAVRAIHPTRAVIIGGENWSGINSLANLPLFDDPNVHPTFHYYDPFLYTHQGASWTAPDIPPVGRDFPTHEDAAQLAKDVLAVEAYKARTGKTPFMGEVGAYDANISLEDRVAYHRTITDAFAPTGIGICVWAYANTFPFYDKEEKRWLPGMLGALGLEESE
ncbi:cellulase family glycosylhydrolase [Altererythrobacter aurantiacus]|uniref:Cellulase family glycosylhydrolase n=1 Tax=Parapontixanthobacter aurantiacus TaxID=1463599 RepID=A0A844ZF29_9SPHN|nr:glycoside hydrolase family 5 protein [Parapontixanthobacter aurantiacus]MXO85842.1 cellulase family glycosylhydrolase [Parapontixanthobacter aurantiacus]